MRIGMRLAATVCLSLVPGALLGQPGSLVSLGERKSVGTIYGTVITVLLETHLRNVPVYVFTLPQSQRLREMDQRAYERAHAPGVVDGEYGAIETRNAGAIADLIPKLPRTALGKSDEHGAFEFHKLPAGRQYYLVAFFVAEDGLFLAIKITPTLKEGEKLKVDLRDDVPWNKRFKVNW